MSHSFDMLTFDFLLKPPQPVTGLFLSPLLPLSTLNMVSGGMGGGGLELKFNVILENFEISLVDTLLRKIA